MATDKQIDQPVGGKLYTFGKSRFADNKPSYFFIRNDIIQEIACGDEHTAVVCQSGRLFVFGKNDSGQLGLGNRNTIKKPQCVKALKPEKAVHVACGRAHTLVSTVSGRLFAWGSNSDGQLGLGNTDDQDTPCEIKDAPWEEIPIIQIGAGSQYSALLTEDGRVWVWGSNSDGQLGLGNEEPLLSIATLMPFSSETAIQAFACGAYHLVLLSNDGDVYTCGEAELGKLGLADSTGRVATPTHVQLGMRAKAVACGGSHTLILGENGEIVGFGSNINGQLGLGEDVEGSLLPISIIIGDQVNPKSLASIYCGDMHSAFITLDNDLYTCGDSQHGRLCRTVTSETDSKTPNLVEDFKNTLITKLACGGCHTMVLAETRKQDDVEENESKSSSKYSCGSCTRRSHLPIGRVSLPPDKLDTVLSMLTSFRTEIAALRDEVTSLKVENGELKSLVIGTGSGAGSCFDSAAAVVGSPDHASACAGSSWDEVASKNGTKDENELPPLRVASSAEADSENATSKNEDEPKDNEEEQEENENNKEDQEEKSINSELQEVEEILDQNSNEPLQIESLSIHSLDNADFVNDNANTGDSSDTIEIGQSEREPSPDIEDIPHEDNIEITQENSSGSEEVQEAKLESKIANNKKESGVKNFFNKLIHKKPSSAPVDRTITDTGTSRALSVGAVIDDVDKNVLDSTKSTHRGSKTCAII